MRVVLASAGRLMIVEPTTGQSTIRLEGRAPRCLAVDARGRIWCGTSGHGVFTSDDGGVTWLEAGLAERDVTAMAAAPTGGDASTAPAIYAGLEPSEVHRTDDSGATWRELEGLLELPSASSWSFPPRPWTHHVRAILVDPLVPATIHIAIEAGALVRSSDGGRTWEDRVPEGPIDSHSLAAHPARPGWIGSAAGDGWFESEDGGDHWSSPHKGLGDGYLWGVALDPYDPATAIVSAAPGPMAAHDVRRGESRIYRRAKGLAWERVEAGLPEPRGTTAAALASGPDAGVFWAASNHGLFRSADGGEVWERLEISWPEELRAARVDTLAILKVDR